MNTFCIFTRRLKAVAVRMFPSMVTEVSRESSTVLLFIHCLSTLEFSDGNFQLHIAFVAIPFLVQRCSFIPFFFLPKTFFC